MTLRSFSSRPPAAGSAQLPIRGGITAIALDAEGKVSRLTTVWDGAMLPLDEVKALVVLSIE